MANMIDNLGYSYAGTKTGRFIGGQINISHLDIEYGKRRVCIAPSIEEGVDTLVKFVWPEISRVLHEAEMLGDQPEKGYLSPLSIIGRIVTDGLNRPFFKGGWKHFDRAGDVTRALLANNPTQDGFTRALINARVY